MPDSLTDATEYLRELFTPSDHIVMTLVHKQYSERAAEVFAAYSALSGANTHDAPLPDALQYLIAHRSPSEPLPALELLFEHHPKLRPLRPIEQRTALAHTFATARYGWLRFMNAQGYEVYSTFNTVQPGSHGRTKAVISEIQHLYLDFDVDGERALRNLQSRSDLPHPNYVVSTSEHKYQVLWKVQGFTLPAAEHLLRALARDTGADIAATDAARVLRVPGFFNHKYNPAWFVRALRYHTNIFQPHDFQALMTPSTASRPLATLRPSTTMRQPPKSRSEADLGNTLARLRKYEDPPGSIPAADVAEAKAWLAAQRPDKPNPEYYADLTVEKALAIIASTPRERPLGRSSAYPCR